MKEPLEPFSNREREIFLAANEKPPGAERASFLEGACLGDAQLRAAVEALLANANNSLLDRVAEEVRPTQVVPLSEAPGTVINRYTLLQKIGDGGFGAVYMAEQKEPVRRRVALKIIKLGMDTQQVVARFEAVDAAAAELVKLRCFIGLSLPEAAEALNIPLRSAERSWAYARAWLRRDIGFSLE